MIRKAAIADASRIAEILIFSKRMNYRTIFRNDKVSFGEMQVYPLAKRYIDNPQELDGIWVYDDEFVKGMINISQNQILEKDSSFSLAFCKQLCKDIFGESY